MIYADNAATTKLEPIAFDAMVPFLLEDYGNASQPYSFARKPQKALRESREIIAHFISANPDEIIFTSGGTESDNWAIKGVSIANRQKRPIITSAFEHHAVLHACAALERQGYPVAYLCPTQSGYVTASILNKIITDNTGLVSVMAANNEIGTVQPIKELSDIAHEHGAVFHTDAVQAVGHIPLDVHDLGVDLLSASAHKFNGPKGVGFLYVKRGTKIISYADGGAQEFEMRAGTENIAGIVGMAAALKANCEMIHETTTRIRTMEVALLGDLKQKNIKFKRNGGDDNLPGLISLSFPGADGEALLHRLDLSGICVSTGSACNGANSDISHVLQAIQLEEDYARGTIRISLGKSNTLEDVKLVAQAIYKILCSME